MSIIAPGTEFGPVDVSLRDGRRVTLRAVCPQDREKLHAAIKRLSPESRYARFMSPLHELSPQLLERAVHPERETEVQLVAVWKGPPEMIVGGGRYSAGTGSKDCEFALAVIDEWQGLGLARKLLEALMLTARARGFEHMEGFILSSNSRMLTLAGKLGFIEVSSPEGPTVRLLRRDLCD
ncbi:MAG: GNAT family N-acetyltransferase, partial [Gammaproteobacteria bacterium]